MTKDNNLLGKFESTGIAPVKGGVPQIGVAFEVDVNGILNVSGQEKGTRKGESITITITNDHGRLSQDEIQRMIAEAEEFAEEDRAFSSKVAARNGLDCYVFNLRNQAQDEQGFGSKMDTDDKETFIEAVKEAAKWLDEYGASATMEDFEEQKEKLSGVAYPITIGLYEHNGDDGEGEGWEHTEL